MTVSCEPFRAEHWREIDVQDAQVLMREHAEVVATEYERGGEGFTLRVDGRIVACAGVYAGELWASLARDCPMVVVHKAALRLLSVYRDRALTAAADAGFAPGCRWLEMLGFTWSRTEDDYAHLGRPHHVYVRSAA